MPELAHLHRSATREARIFTVATIVCVIHALDDAFIGRQAGIGIGQHALAGLLAVLIGLGAIAAFSHLRPGLRAALAIVLGVPALVNGAMHVTHIVFDAPARSDLSGVAATAAGIVLIVLAASIPWRHRGEGARTAAGRWLARVVAVAGSFLLAVLVIVPIALAIFETHKPRERIGDAPSAAYRDVSFEATDGLRLSGWYLPSRNGAAVIVVHGGGGDRNGAVRHAEMLARHGYGVLLYDARGRGDSEGTPNSYGWDWEKDAFGALDFLRARPGVDPRRIGALGLSSGADTVLELGARRRGLRAIVADGAALRTLEDTRRVVDTGPDVATAWVMYKAIRVLSGQPVSRPLGDLVAQITAPTLLISGDRGPERDFNIAYAKANPSRMTHWNLPDAGHTAALRHYPRLYEQRVIAFLDGHLLGTGAG